MSLRHARSARHAVLCLAVAVLAALAALGAAAPRVSAYGTYLHGGITDCGVCHTDNHANWPPASEKCLTCHTGYALADISSTCWTCHTPGQDMAAARVDGACTATCHLAAGGSVQHAAHDGRPAACTQCHPPSPSLSDPGGSPHHTVPPPPVPSVASFLPVSGAAGTQVTVVGTGFTRATAVTFGGVPAAVFRVVSDAEVSAVVPVGAVSGPIAVTTRGGTGASATGFVVPGLVTPALTIAARPGALRRGGLVRVAGALTPRSLAGARVGLTTQRRTGASWTLVKTAGVTAAADGSYAWSWRPGRTGSYRVRASLPAAGGHAAAGSAWAAFRVR